MFRRSLLLTLWLTVTCAQTFAATAPGNTRKEELTELRGRIEALQKKLAASEDSKNEAADALRESERAISQANRALRGLADEQRVVSARMADLQAQSRGINSDIEAQRARLGRLLYQQYIGVQPDVVKLLLNNENPNQIARDLQYLTYLARARADLIVTMRSNLERISGLAEETTRQSAELAAIEADQQAQRKVLETEKNARQAVLTKVSRQIADQRREISTLKRNENRLTKLIEQLSRMLARKKSPALRSDRVPDAGAAVGAFAHLRGRLNLPVRGELRNRFGTPREGSGVLWKGVFIAAGTGQEVKSIAAGRVVFADWLRGFGNLLIIDHGDGFMSLYGNNESLFKQVGDTAQIGETVASVGNSGGNMDSGLYFEIRHQGKAFDPLAWVGVR